MTEPLDESEDLTQSIQDHDVDVFENTSLTEASESESRWVHLPSADILPIDQAAEILRWRESDVIAIVGERNGGKTTLVTELYERFLRGPFAGFYFHGSASLHGFESKTFLSRANSGSVIPDTPRTSKLDGLNFFHLSIANTELQVKDFLISERAGEVYRDVRDQPELINGIIEVRKAKIIVFIMDGERIADPMRRAEAMASVRTLARAITASNFVKGYCQAHLVTTKWDLLEGDHNKDARDVLLRFENNFLDMHKTNFAKVLAFKVAARDPRVEGLQPGYGLDLMLRSWFADSAFSFADGIKAPELNDEFDRLLMRRGNQ